MALDVAEFLWSKFLKSLAELDSESNSGSITISVFKSSIKSLVSDFEAIKDVFNGSTIIPERYTYSETIDVLYKLNNALAECRVFTHECTELNNKLSLFNVRRLAFISSIKRRLTGIKADLEKLRQQETSNHRAMTRVITEPKLSTQVFGFDKESKEIEDLLLLEAEGSSSSSGGELRAIGVVGIAGVGKTTLVQKVLEIKTVKQKFKHILWLPFSFMSEEEEEYTTFNFETLIYDSDGPTLEVKGLDNILESLSRLLSSDKCPYLIVLDDVCHRQMHIMERLCRGLPRHNGGVVIVTTRLKAVARKLESQLRLKWVHVQPLPPEICGSIFEEHVSDEATRKEEVVNQCHGLPLVAKEIANIFVFGEGDRKYFGVRREIAHIFVTSDRNL